MEAALTENVTIRQIEQELARLRDAATAPGQAPNLRTSVMTHIAWVPERWVDAATDTLAGMGERHPSRTILLFPSADEPRDELDGEVDLRCFVRAGEQGQVCSEVVSIKLCGPRAEVPASVVAPLLIPDLPVFLRWRGEPDFGGRPLAELTGIADRLVLDSNEWSDCDLALERLPELFDRIVVSDIAWAKVQPWREACASLWPGIAEAESVRIAGLRGEVLLLWGWLRSRLRRELELEHEPAGEIELVEIDGVEVAPARAERRSASDLLSDQLEIFARDRIYEEAVRGLAAVPA
ncbi:MAG TPA: glucose-6-phosphate dehydrogenase assembly protein OpcA [Gaiellaceae bacterium]|nr:glucose-6-phosphate dehydrogenase assembly protein OpcA [Gaiellaceae bacterium]